MSDSEHHHRKDKDKDHGSQPAMPWADEAEKSILGCLLQDPVRLVPEAMQTLKENVFYHPSHQIVFTCILAMHEAHKPIDLVTVTNELRSAHDLDKIGGPAFVSELCSYIHTVSYWSYYVQVVLEKWHLRRLIQTSEDIAMQARRFGKEEEEDLSQFISRAEQRLFEQYQELTEKSSRRGMCHVKEILPEVIDQIETAMASKGHVTRGIATGLTSLDRMTMGLEAGMFVIAARPSKGKTALVMQVALNIGTGCGDYDEFRQDALPVGIFSLETNDANLVRRGLLNLASLNMQRLKDGFMDYQEKESLARAHRKLAESNIYVEACYGLTIQEFRAKARNATRKLGLKMIIIDYLQLMQTTGNVKKAGNRQAELAEISIGIKYLAHELNIPILVLAQLNRDGDCPRPKMSQIKDCGQIEQDADYCALLCDAPEWASQNDPEDCPWEYLGLDIVKQKDGPTTSHGDPIVLRFLKECFQINSRETKLFSNDENQHQPRQGPVKFDANRPKRPRGRPRKDGSDLNDVFPTDED